MIEIVVRGSRARAFLWLSAPAISACGYVGIELTSLGPGTCPLACENPHGASACEAGLCVPACASGFGDCDGNPQNGCETSLRDQVTSCGGCAIACLNPAGATACVAGTCKPECNVGHADCNADPRDGCEARTSADPRHCGACAAACPSGDVCVDGACRRSPCPPGRASCGSDPTACEVDTSSLMHCGFCGNACITPNGAPRCSDGACEVASCSAGFADCNGAPGDGCEAALTSVANCGSCGMPCTTDVPGAIADCSGGVCAARCGDLSGVWALRMQIPTTWPSGGFVASGRGTHEYVSRVVLAQTGSTLTGSMTPCGRSVPPFENSVTPERYQVVYPPALFDRALPADGLSFTLGGLGIGASVVAPPAATLLGIAMSNPLADPWPSLAAARAAATGAGDHDADADPGVTVIYTEGGGYSLPQTSGTLFAQRASRASLATRLRFSLSGTLTSCTSSSGSADADDIEFRTVACRTENDAQCSASQYGHLDDNAPGYVEGGATYQMVRVAPASTTVSCATVRAALSD